MDAESEEGFREFARARFPSLRALACVTCGDWQAAEHAVSGALSRLYLKWDRVTAPEAYARKAVVRAAIGEKLRPWRREHAVGEAFPDVAIPDVPAAATSSAPVVKDYQQPKGLGFTAGGGRAGACRSVRPAPRRTATSRSRCIATARPSRRTALPTPTRTAGSPFIGQGRTTSPRAVSRSAARRPWHFAEFERFGKKLSMDDVRRILRGLTFTAVEDRNTWKTL